MCHSACYSPILTHYRTNKAANVVQLAHNGSDEWAPSESVISGRDRSKAGLVIREKGREEVVLSSVPASPLRVSGNALPVHTWADFDSGRPEGGARLRRLVSKSTAVREVEPGAPSRFWRTALGHYFLWYILSGCEAWLLEPQSMILGRLPESFCLLLLGRMEK